MMLLANIITGLLLSLSSSQAGTCDDFPFKKLLGGAPRYEYRGQYVNRAYEYSVVIPKGIIAYDGRNETNHSGFGLALGERSQSFIFVRGEHNSLEYDTPREAATQAVEWMRQGGKEVESVTISESHLGELNSALLVVSYTCRGSLKHYKRSSLMALGPDKRFLYTLEIYGPADQYESDRTVLDKIIKSWKVISGPRRQRHGYRRGR
jgi:hypothetical protein